MKHHSGKRININLVKYSIIGLAIILVFVFLSFFAKQFSKTNLTVGWGDRKISIETAGLTNAVTASKETYIDSEIGFAFTKPENISIRIEPPLIGIRSYLNSDGGNVSEKEFTQIISDAGGYYGKGEIGNMLENMKCFRFIVGEPISVELTDQSTSDYLEWVIPGLVQQNKLQKKDIPNFRKQQFGNMPATLSNSFSITVFKKSYLESLPFKYNIVRLVLESSHSMRAWVKSIAADDRATLTALTVDIKNIKVNGLIKDLQIEKMSLYTENSKYFFHVESSYSPQTNSPEIVWKVLEEMIHSFRAAI